MTDYRTLLYGTYRSNFYATVNPCDSASKKAVNDSYDVIFNSHLPSDRRLRILDIGCGSGFLIEYFLSHDYTAVKGIDISAEQVEYCKTHGLPVEQAEATSFLKSNQGWGLIISWDVVEHLTKEEIVHFLTAIYAALVPGGEVVIGTGNASSIYGSTARYMDFTHEVLFTESSLRQVMLACGFTDVHVTDTKASFGLRPKQLVRWVGLKLCRMVLRASFMLEVGSDAPRLLGKLIFARARKPVDAN
jgi:cyclopropane fatty-acyl-phospholipid synthase-like methyltransferase